MAKKNNVEIDDNSELEANNGVLLEETFLQLEKIIDNLEREDVPLEEAFDYYKKGIELVKRCNDKLDEVEKKIVVLNEEGGLDEF